MGPGNQKLSALMGRDPVPLSLKSQSLKNLPKILPSSILIFIYKS
jgi:hypothetical protein